MRNSSFIKFEYLLFLIIAFVLYGNTLKNEWNMDDDFVLRNNEWVMKGVSGIPEILSSPYFESENVHFGYRPITKIFFAIEYQIWGVQLPLSHAFNVLLYFLIGVLLYKLLLKLLNKKLDKKYIIFIIIIWLFHPVHTEVVASLKNREELLWLLFGLISIHFFLKYSDSKKITYLILGLISYIFSYYSKQNAISLLIVIPLIIWYYKNLSFRFSSYKYEMFGLLALLIIGYFSYKIPNWIFVPDQLEMFSYENPIRFNNSFALKTSISAMALLFYLKIILFPHPLIFYYGLYTIPELPVLSTWVIISLIVHLFLIFVFIRGLRKRNLYSLGIGLYLLFLFPFSNIPIEINGIVGERFQFAPSIGFSILLVIILLQLFKINAKNFSFKSIPLPLYILTFVLILFYGGKTIARNSSWKNHETLFTNDLKYTSNSIQAQSITAEYLMTLFVENLKKGETLNQNQQLLDSISNIFKNTINLNPNNYRNLNNLGDIYLNYYHKPDSALIYLKKADSLQAKNVFVTINLAKTYFLLSQKDKAIHYSFMAIKYNPSKEIAWNNLIELLKYLNYQPQLDSIYTLKKLYMPVFSNSR